MNKQTKKRRGVRNEGKLSCKGEEYCKARVSWPFLGRGAHDVRRTATLDKLASSCPRGDKFAKKVRRHTENHKKDRKIQTIEENPYPSNYPPKSHLHAL